MFGREEDGWTFIINDYQNLPGKISLKISEDIIRDAKYSYLHHPVKNKYELLSTSIDKRELEIDIAGQYLIADKKISPIKLNPIYIAIALVCVTILIGAYIFVKKKYWFW